jgi:hypothetical protein
MEIILNATNWEVIEAFTKSLPNLVQVYAQLKKGAKGNHHHL